MDSPGIIYWANSLLQIPRPGSGFLPRALPGTPFTVNWCPTLSAQLCHIRSYCRGPGQCQGPHCLMPALSMLTIGQCLVLPPVPHPLAPAICQGSLGCFLLSLPQAPASSPWVYQASSTSCHWKGWRGPSPTSSAAKVLPPVTALGRAQLFQQGAGKGSQTLAGTELWIKFPSSCQGPELTA